MTGNRASGRKPDLKRRRLAAALHAQGLTFAEIGRRLGITRQAAMHLVQSGTVPTPGASSAACLTCRRRVPYCRGCCRSCWIKHCQAVANGEARWSVLEARGLVAPPKRQGRKPDMQRRRLAAALRAKGLTFTAIGERLGIAPKSAADLVKAHNGGTRRGQ
jgi:lambda repressor-like predicted transcriptional regulator